MFFDMIICISERIQTMVEYVQTLSSLTVICMHLAIQKYFSSNKTQYIVVTEKENNFFVHYA
jgi:hypothetical protein